MHDETVLKSDTKADISKHSSTTLFVRNIPFEVDKDALQTFFADFGPLQSCFLVSKKEPEESTHAGYGFVQFALKEDASKAVEELRKKHGAKKLLGRKLKIEFALRKDLKNIQDKDIIVNRKSSQEQKPVGNVKLYTVHILIQGGALAQKVLEARLRKATGKPISITQITQNSYKVNYSKETEAEKVIKKLHSKSFQMEKGGTTYTLLCVLITMALKQHRIILRNLPFNTTLDTLSPFNAFGQIIEVELPKHPDTGSFRGFAFLQYSKREEAEQAIAKGNGIKLERRPVVVDWALSKKAFSKEAISPTNEPSNEPKRIRVE